MSDFDQATMLAAARVVLAAGGGDGTQVPTTPQPVARTPLEVMADVKEILPQLKEFLPYLDMLKKNPVEQPVQAREAEEKIHTDDISSEEEPAASELMDLDDPALMPKLNAQLSEQIAELAMAQYDAHKAFVHQFEGLVQRFDNLDERFNRLISGLQMMMQPTEDVEPEKVPVDSTEKAEGHVNGEEKNITDPANGFAI